MSRTFCPTGYQAVRTFSKATVLMSEGFRNQLPVTPFEKMWTYLSLSEENNYKGPSPENLDGHIGRKSYSLD